MLRADPATKRARRRTSKSGKASPAIVELSADDQLIYEALRTWRLNTAKAQGVPPYVIFHDKTLAAIASVRPLGAEALKAISGVGEKKAARYAEAVAEVLSEAA